MQIRAACPLSKNEEVFNTFGELDNTELVCKYGFALPQNPFSSVQLSKEVVVKEAGKLLGAKECKRRLAYLAEQRWILPPPPSPTSQCQKCLYEAGSPEMLACVITSVSQDYRNLKNCSRWACVRSFSFAHAILWARGMLQPVIIHPFGLLLDR